MSTLPVESKESVSKHQESGVPMRKKSVYRELSWFSLDVYH